MRFQGHGATVSKGDACGNAELAGTAYRGLKHVLLLRGIYETISSMKDTHVVHILDVALLEIESDSMFLCKEMESIQSFSLRF